MKAFERDKVKLEELKRSDGVRDETNNVKENLKMDENTVMDSQYRYEHVPSDELEDTKHDNLHISPRGGRSIRWS